MKAFGPLDARLQMNGVTQLFGQPQSGKSYLSVQIALKRDQVYREPFNDCIYYYMHEQPLFKEAKNTDDEIKFISDSSDLEEELSSGSSPVLLVLDDFIWQALGDKNKFMCKLFTQLTHHLQISVVYQSQVLFAPKSRVLNLSTHYYCLFRSFHRAQIGYFFRNLDPENYRFLLESYHASTDNKPYSHFMISHHPLDDDQMRFRDNIIPGEGVRVFTPKK